VSSVLCVEASLAGTISEFRPKTYDSKEAQLRALIESNQTADVTKLIKDGVNVNFKYEDGSYPIFAAVYSGDLDIVKLLIENGAEVNRKDGSNRTALHYAALEARPDIINVLIENGATVKNNPALLHWAVKGGSVYVIKLLIEKGANVNDNQALLHYAINTGHPEIVKVLIEKGANVNVKCRNQMTPLIVAVMKGDIDSVKLILDHGVEKIDDTDKERHTALLYASSSGNKEMSKLLIQNGANMFAAGLAQFTFYKWAEEDSFFLEHLKEDIIEVNEMEQKKKAGAT
ncbi:putative ankyrin repeat protein RF_0381, partial [Sitodiplosis mosellana]|uniref:putative ankyrin repeat protein RF_0381 n=1 Tax=Sitodiplosis mosellana TaxID=263140 RepID=UPI0024437639